MPLMSDIAARARSLADLEVSKVISYTDVVNSANESWRTIYNQLCDSNDDFFVKDTTFTNIASYAIPSMLQQFLIPLPADCYKIRTVDYYSGTQWMPMERLSLNMRDALGDQPRYRIQGNNLFLNIGQGTQMPSQIKVMYYPPAESVTLPEDPVVYGSSVTSALFSTISSAFYIPATYYPNTNVKTYDYMLYNYNGTLIAESYGAGTTSTLYTGTTANIWYYKGYIYFIQSSNIYKVAWTLGSTTTLVPVAITTSNDVVNFQIYNNLITYSTASTTNTCLLDGTSVVQIEAFATNSYLTVNSVPVYVKTSDSHIYYNGTDISTHTTNTITTNGSLIYAYNSDKNVSIISVSGTTATEIDLITNSDVVYMGPYVGSKLPVIYGEQQVFEAISASPDYSFSYPLNVLYEWMSYQMATDYRRKYDSVNEALEARKASIWEDFLHHVIRRDEYKLEKIQNVYANRQGLYPW